MVPTGFAEFDSSLGGLRGAKDYLLYGSIGGGKSSFALSFLYQGLIREETCAIVVRRRPEAVMAHAKELGWDLEPHLRSQKLIFIEYPEELDQRSPRLYDDADIAEEFRSLLDGLTINRLVFDPATPLLAAAGGSSPLRIRRVMASFAALEATCLYLVDIPEGEAYLAGCKDHAHGVFRLEPDARAAGLRRMVIERLPGVEGRRSPLLFELRPGEGLAASLAPEMLRSQEGLVQGAVWPVDSGMPLGSAPAFTFRPTKRRQLSGQWTVLVADPDPERRRDMKAAIEPIAAVAEVESSGDCLLQIYREQPDLVVLALEIPGISAIDITRKVRRMGVGSPILVTGALMRRLSDRVRILGAGADLAMPRPFDLRTFKLHVRNLLNRSDSVGDRARKQQPGFDIVSEPRRDGVFCTTLLNEFRARMESEARHCRQNDLPFTVISLNSLNALELAQEIAGVCSFVSRRQDMTYLGANGAAVLLTEATSADSFLRRFDEHWKGTAFPEIECATFDGSDAFVQTFIDQSMAAMGTLGAAGERPERPIPRVPGVAGIAEEVLSTSQKKKGFHAIAENGPAVVNGAVKAGATAGL